MPNRTASHPDDLARVEDVLEQIEHLESQLRDVRDGLTHSHRLATLGTIASIIAHEYNNILTPIISYAQLALANEGDHELMAKAVRKALNGAERAANISSSLLGFAREADEQHAAVVPKVIEETVACMARDPKKDGVELVIEAQDVRVAMSPLNLQQVLLNLMLNAMKVMKTEREGRLTVTAEARGTLVVIHVADTGPGIPPQIMQRLFEPFVTHSAARARGEQGGEGEDESPSEPRGTGLGLSICRDLVRNAGGEIEVESELGKGATFRITLPKAEEIIDPA